MNETILRGFCQKGWPVQYFGTGPDPVRHIPLQGSDSVWRKCNHPDKTIIPVLFLSQKQIYEISRSKEFIDWRVDYGSVWRTPEDGLYVLSVLLKQNPFLVAKILSASHSTEEGVKE